MTQRVKFDLSSYSLLDAATLEKSTLPDVQVSIIESAGKVAFVSNMYNKDNSKERKDAYRDMIVTAHAGLLSLLAHVTIWSNSSTVPEIKPVGNSVLLPAPSRISEWIRQAVLASEQVNLWEEYLPDLLNQAIRYAAFNRVYTGDMRVRVVKHKLEMKQREEAEHAARVAEAVRQASRPKPKQVH